MNREADLERTLRSWLREPDEVPDDFGDVLARIPSTGQRRGRLGLRPRWGIPAALLATSVVLASAIVVLVAGSHLIGMPRQDDAAGLRPAAVAPTAPPETDRTELPLVAALLPGVELELEEVESGVFRVSSDGIRDLRSEPVVDCRRLQPMSTGRIVAGMDGSVWLMWSDRFLRLGDATEHTWAAEQVVLPDDDIAIGPDGTILHASAGWVSDDSSTASLYASGRCPGWWSGDGALRRFDGTSWSTVHQVPYDSTDEVEVGLDGTVWIAWRHQEDETGKGARLDVARFEDGAWHDVGPVGTNRDDDVVGLGLSSDGSAYVLTQRHAGGQPLWRLVHGETARGWEPLEPPAKDVRSLAVTPEGRLWARFADGLASGDGIAWSEYEPPPGASWSPAFDLGPSDTWIGAPDGSLWVTPWSAGGRSACAGIMRFDGVGWSRYLQGLCVYSASAALDGSVWVRAGEWPDRSRPTSAGVVDTYVIIGDHVM